MAVLSAGNVRTNKPGRPLDIILTQVLCFADIAESLADKHVRQSTSFAPQADGSRNESFLCRHIGSDANALWRSLV